MTVKRNRHSTGRKFSNGHTFILVTQFISHKKKHYGVN